MKTLKLFTLPLFETFRLFCLLLLRTRLLLGIATYAVGQTQEATQCRAVVIVPCDVWHKQIIKCAESFREVQIILMYLTFSFLNLVVLPFFEM